METTSVMNGIRYYVMAVTPTRLYSFTGFGSLDVSNFSIFGLKYYSMAELLKYIHCSEDKFSLSTHKSYKVSTNTLCSFVLVKLNAFQRLELLYII